MDFVARIRKLAKAGALRASDHAYGRLVDKGISYRQLLASLDAAEILERYPGYRHGPCFLARHVFAEGQIAHAVWGIGGGSDTTAVLVTAYWPDEDEWDNEFRRRR
ncbi:MAG: DUF4258 domain-containing protein [Hyphomicrobiales bacterium]